MNFIDRQIRPSIKVVELTTNDNELVKNHLPKTMVKILTIKDLGIKDGKYIKRVMFTRYSNITYDDLVNGMVRDKYSESAEFAILRKAINSVTSEYAEYNTFVEECKTLAKAWIQKRDSLIG